MMQGQKNIMLFRQECCWCTNRRISSAKKKFFGRLTKVTPPAHRKRTAFEGLSKNDSVTSRSRDDKPGLYGGCLSTSQGMALGWSWTLATTRAADDAAESGHLWTIKDSPKKAYTDVRRERARKLWSSVLGTSRVHETVHQRTSKAVVAYSGILFVGGSTNSDEDRGQKERGSGGGSPIVRGIGGSCNLVQENSFHVVKFS